MFKDGFERREALIKEQSNIKNRIEDLDKKLAELKFLYDQYFIGNERLEPLKLRDEVADMIKALSATYIKSTQLKFRLNTLISKHVTYKKLWERVTREIEEGKYKRDIFRIKVKEWQAGYKVKRDEKKLADAIGKSDPVVALYNQYIDSRKKSNESVDNIHMQKFSETVNKQITEIKKKFNCKAVTFRVIIENGKTKLKATPKTD
jgi:hypothetical protein